MLVVGKIAAEQADLSTNKLLSSAWLDRLDLAWFPQIKLPIVDSKPNQALIEGLLDRLDRLDSSEHISCL
jgi:hypothetical protein